MSDPEATKEVPVDATQDDARQEEAPIQETPVETNNQPDAEQPTDDHANPDDGVGEEEVQENSQPDHDADAEVDPDAVDPDAEVPADAEGEMYYYDDAQIRAQKKAERDKKLEATKQKRQEEQSSRQKRLGERAQAISDGKSVLDLTRCYDCSTHQWCTKHKEPKYDHMQALFEAEVTASLGANWHVAVNCLHPKNKIGAFEVEFNGRVCFSKLEKQYWPNMKVICGKVSEMTSEAEAEVEGDSG